MRPERIPLRIGTLDHAIQLYLLQTVGNGPNWTAHKGNKFANEASEQWMDCLAELGIAGAAAGHRQGAIVSSGYRALARRSSL